ncbi:MAG: nucleotide-binding protein [Chloroflexi bacterium]|nr:nucleotide-binding protein [Chloroflexota bacterium]
MGRKVFLIHGRNHGTRDTVARFLEKLQIKVVIMMEQPNQGRTLIEKLEGNADTDFAIALLTPDDEGGLKGGVQKARSRQNVILELGYFMGRLGRNRVCALVQGDVEIPTDYYGVVYIDFDDSNAWQQQLIGELKAARFSIDANRAFT